MEKTFLTILVALSAIFSCMAEEPSFNLSVLKKGDKAERIVWLRNTTDHPIAILDIQTGCVCTKASFDTSPVPPGDSTKIDIVFSAKDLGVFYKTVDVKTSDKGCDMKITLRGRVEK